MKVRFVCDGAQYSLYALELGDEHDYGPFKEEQKRDRPGEMAAMMARLERLAEAGVSAKKQKKTPQGAIDRAKARRAEFLAAMQSDSETVTVLVNEGVEPVRVLE